MSYRFPMGARPDNVAVADLTSLFDVGSNEFDSQLRELSASKKRPLHKV
jgi:hypothetical protein